MSRILCVFVCIPYVLTDEIKFNLTRYVTPAPGFNNDYSNVFVCENDKSSYSFRGDETVITVRLHSSFKLLYVKCSITAIGEPSVQLLSHFKMTSENNNYNYNVTIDINNSMQGRLKCLVTPYSDPSSEKIKIHWAKPTCAANIISNIEDSEDKDVQQSPVPGYIGVLGVPFAQGNDTDFDLRKTLIDFEQHKTVIEFDENFIFNIKCYSGDTREFSGIITREEIIWRNISWPTIHSTIVAKNGENTYESRLKLNDEAIEYKCVDTVKKMYRTFKLVTRNVKNKDLSADSNYTLIILACGAPLIAITGLILCWKFKVLQRFKKWRSSAGILRPRAPTPPLYAQPYKVEYETINYDECQIQTYPHDSLQDTSNPGINLASPPIYMIPGKNTEPGQVNWKAPDNHTPTGILTDSDQMWVENDGYQIVP